MKPIALVMAFSLFAGAALHSQEKDERIEDPIMIEALVEQAEEPDDVFPAEHRYAAVGALVLFALQGYRLFTSFSRYSGR